MEEGVPILLEKERYAHLETAYRQAAPRAALYQPAELADTLLDRFVSATPPDPVNCLQLRHEYEVRLCRRVVETLAPAAGGVILNVGSGFGTFDGQLARHLDPTPMVIGVEMVEGMAQAAQRLLGGPRLQYVCADGNDLPLGDGSCDWAYSKNAIEHGGAGMMREIARVLKPGGRCLLIGPATYALLPFLPGGFYSWLKTGDAHAFTPGEYREMFAASGLRIVSHDALAVRAWQRRAWFLQLPLVVQRGVYGFFHIYERLLRAVGLKAFLWMQVYLLEKPVGGTACASGVDPG